MIFSKLQEEHFDFRTSILNGARNTEKKYR